VISDGLVIAVANAAFTFPPLSAGESFIFAFDYTVQDGAGNVSNPAHVAFTITDNAP
jgi:hypothetical protein